MVPITLIEEILLNCYESVEVGHQGIVRTYDRVKTNYYWKGHYADVAKHVQSRDNCSTSKRKPYLKE